MSNLAKLLCFGLLACVCTLAPARIEFCIDHVLRAAHDPLAGLKKGRPTLVLIDGLSSGGNFSVRARELFSHLNIVHVRSNSRLSENFYERFGYQAKTFDGRLVHNGSEASFQHILGSLRPWKENGLQVAVGAETGIGVYNRLATYLGLREADSEFATRLTDKEVMAKAVAPYVKTIPGAGFSRWTDAAEWIEDTGLDFPVFAKPISSSGSYGGQIIRSREELKRVFKKLIGKRDPLGTRIERLMVQKYIQSPHLQEFAVDVLVDPEAGVVLTDLYQYRKREANGRIVYEASHLIRFDPTNPVHASLFKAARGVAKGLGAQREVLHIEFFVIDGEVIFIEAGARPAGGGMPLFARACGANDQITMQLLAMFDRERFLQLALAGPQLDTEGLMIDMQGPKGQVVLEGFTSDEALAKIIPGFVSSDWHNSPGDIIGQTTDLFNSPGVLSIRGTESYDTVRKLERDGALYQTRPVGWIDRASHSAKKWRSVLLGQ